MESLRKYIGEVEHIGSAYQPFAHLPKDARSSLIEQILLSRESEAEIKSLAPEHCHVRLPDGSIEQRKAIYRDRQIIGRDAQLIIYLEPELSEGELWSQTIGDPLYSIVR